MERNPWTCLPAAAPYVLPADSAALGAFNAKAKPEHRYETALHPEPFLGSLDAPVLLLALNPGLASADYEVHQREDCLTHLRASTRQDGNATLYYLEECFANTPGGKWWHSKVKQLVETCGIRKVAKALCCVQYYPYHSTKFSRVPANTGAQEFTARAIREAIGAGKLIVVMRSLKLWVRLVPELETYGNVITLRNPLNPALSPANLGDAYGRLVAAVTTV